MLFCFWNTNEFIQTVSRTKETNPRKKHVPQPKHASIHQNVNDSDIDYLKNANNWSICSIYINKYKFENSSNPYFANMLVSSHRWNFPLNENDAKFVYFIRSKDSSKCGIFKFTFYKSFQAKCKLFRAFFMSTIQNDIFHLKFHSKIAK